MKFMLFVLLATCGCVVFYRLRCAQKVNDWGSLTSPVIFPTQNDTESRVSPALRPSQGKELTCLKAKSAENPKYDVQQVNQCGYDCQTKKVWRAHDSSESTYQTFKSKCGDPQKDDVVYNPFEPGKCFRKRPSQWCGVVPPKSTFKPGYVLDFAGTWTKYNWDCDESGGRNYRSYAPSRGLDCAEFDRLRNKINSEVSGTFPSVDEEYYEWLDLVYAVMHAKSQFRMMEVGARYGTWGVRGFKLNQRTRDLNAKIVLVENNRENVGYIREHLKVNAIPESAVTVVDKACSTKTTKDSVSLFDLVNKHEGVLDLLDLDIQGSEAWAVPAAIEIINKKVRLIHIGTHGRGMHASLHKLLESNGWNIRHNFQQSTEYETTWEGKVAFRDGVLSAHNPKYLNDLQPAPNSGYSASLDSQKIVIEDKTSISKTPRVSVTRVPVPATSLTPGKRMVNVPPHEKDSVPADEKNRKVHDDGFFSQEHQEKWLLDNVFHWARNGVFFEAGGRDGIDYSNTYFMEKHLGWTGLVVEANPVLSKQLVKHRDCLTETVCLSDKENETVSYLAYDSGIAGIESSVETGRVKAQLGSRNIALENIRTPMKCKILTNIFVKYNIETVDFFSLDVEGHELQILKGLDLARICVYAFMIENNHNSQVVPNYLVQQGYAKVAHLYIDDLFVRKSPCPLPSSAAKIKEIISKSLKNH